MKRVKIEALVDDAFTKDMLWFSMMREIEEYSEEPLKPKKVTGFFEDHSWDSLSKSAMNMVDGLWIFAKGFLGMAKWALVVFLEGIKWLWSEGLGRKEAKVEAKVKKKVAK